MATRRQGLKRIKKRRLSERSEFPTLPVSGPGGACSPCEARTAIVGAAFFAPLFWRSKKAGRPPGRTPGYSPRQCKSHASPTRHQQQWRLALADSCNGNSNDPLPTRATLRYTCCASTQGERWIRTRQKRTTATATVAARRKCLPPY